MSLSVFDLMVILVIEFFLRYSVCFFASLVCVECSKLNLTRLFDLVSHESCSNVRPLTNLDLRCWSLGFSVP